MVATRSASAHDAATLVELAAATFALACPPGTAQEHIEAFIAEHFTRERFDAHLADGTRSITLVLDDDGTPIGYSMLVFGRTQDEDVLRALTEPPTVELSKVYLLSSSHGRGAAAALMAATLDVVRGRGSRSVWLGVNQQNAKAIRFYEKSGFALAGTKTFLVGPERHDDFVMEHVF